MNRQHRSSVRGQRHGAHASSGQCRIIGGRWRGRKIYFDDAEGMRPTTDRIRETVFNWLQPYVAGSTCLDAFAGSGSLGFEAASRGADDVIMVEKNSEVIRSLKDNLTRLQPDDAGCTIRLMQADVLRWLEHDAAKYCFDIVFLDPPYQLHLLPQICDRLAQSGTLADDAIIYVEYAAGEQIAFPPGWQCIKDKRTAQIAYKLFQNNRPR